MAISIPKKLLIIGIGGAGIVTPFAISSSSKTSSSISSDRRTLSSSKQTSLISPAKEKEEPKLCKVLLSSQDGFYEVLICYDLDKENHINKLLAYKNVYGASLFLLDKTNPKYSLKQFNFLMSVETKDDEGKYDKEKVKQNNWQAYRQKESAGPHYSINKSDYETIGNAFQIKWYDPENPKEFAFPETYYQSRDVFACCRHITFREGIILDENDLKVGSALKNWDKRNTESAEFLSSLDISQTNPHDTKLDELKKEAKYYINLTKEDKYWNNWSGPSPFLEKVRPYNDLSCPSQENMNNEKFILNCFR